ncbi:MAG: hypothetical protein HYU74_03960 [Dechloromonas sp.]|nr:hypothetical protein [Dechloromonas sp.]
MTELYLLLPIIPVVAIAATYSHSIMTERAAKIGSLPFGWFMTVSVGAYWYFYTNTHGYPHGSYSNAFVVLYAVYVGAFIFSLLVFGQLRSKIRVVPYALFGGVVAVGAAIGSFIVLLILYFMTGIVKDS